MRLIALVDFSWAHRGCIVESFTKDQVIDTEDPDLIRVSIDEGWAEEGDAGESARQEAQAAAEDADAAKDTAEARDLSDAAPAEEKAAKPAENKARKSAPENK